MSNTYRFYKAKFPSKSNILKKLLSSPPIFNTKDGFLEGGCIEEGWKFFEFYWHKKIYLNRVDEGGELISEEYVTASRTDFAIYPIDNVYIIRVKNPGRTQKTLFDKIETLAGFGFSVSPITFEIEDYNTMFTDVDSTKMTKISLDGVAFAKGIVGKLEANSIQGNGINLEEIPILSKNNGTIRQIRLHIVKEAITSTIDISASGMVKIGGDLRVYILSMFTKYCERNLTKSLKLK